MDRREFLKSALATAGSAQSAIVLGGTQTLSQFSGPKDVIVVPGAMALRWHEPIALTMQNDARHPPYIVFEDCFLTHFEVTQQERPLMIPAFNPAFYTFGPCDVCIDVQFYGRRAVATPPAQ